MQNYINPIALLNINAENVSDLDVLIIRKAKKSLLAEIELNDTENILYNGIELTKSDCLRVIDELDNKDKKDFHLFIYQNKNFNNFLSKGDITFFNSYKVESIYKLPEFIDFISPYFTQQYEKALSKNFINKNTANVKLLLSIKPVVNDVYYEECYKSTYSIVKNIENEIIGITKEIENKTSKQIQNDFEDLPEIIKNKVDLELINLLPNYFQSLRNQLAQTIRNLARDLNNEPYSFHKPAYAIIEIANKRIDKPKYIYNKGFVDYWK